MNSLAIRTLRTVTRTSPALQPTLLTGAPLLRTRVARAYSTQGGDGSAEQKKQAELPDSPAELKEMIQKLNTTAAEQESKLKETHVRPLAAL